MTEQEVEALLQADPEGQPWRPTPEFFDELQAKMTTIDATPLVASPAPWKLMAAAAVSAAIGAGVWWASQSPAMGPSDRVAVPAATSSAMEPLKPPGSMPGAASSAAVLAANKSPDAGGTKDIKASTNSGEPVLVAAHVPSKPSPAPAAGAAPTAGAAPATAGTAPATVPSAGTAPAAGTVSAASPASVRPASVNKKKSKSAPMVAAAPKPKPRPKATAKPTTKKANDLLSALNKPKPKPAGGGDTASQGKRLSSKTVRAKVQAERGTWSKCTAKTASPLSTMHVKLRIGGNGIVRTAQVTKAGGTPQAVQACILKVLKRLRFDTFSEPNMTIHLPLRLK